MTPRTLAVAAALALLPISELRGAIPYSLAHEVPVGVAFLYCVALNALVGPLVHLFLSTVHRLLARMRWYMRLFDRIVARARHKVEQKVSRYGYLGLVLFVAIPLPITGAYTGTLGAWILGMDRRKTFLAVLVGVIIAGIVVTSVAYLGIEALAVFVKKVPA